MEIEVNNAMTMGNMKRLILTIAIATCGCSAALGDEPDTLPALEDGRAPSNFEQMWKGFDPRAEPLKVEIIHEWEEDEVLLRVVRFRIGVFKGKKATLAAIYGFPKRVTTSGKKIPGLVQIHGGGQYADHKACLTNAKRGYATVSIAWAGRISAPKYRVNPDVVKLFWDDKTDDPNYKLTTDWGAVDGYHAPGRNPGNVFPSAKPAEWTLDTVESPRNSGWFLCALAARRALTFLEHQPEVDAKRLGVYGHSMGGKLTVMTAVDPRVKAAAPSCGGISDRYNSSPLFRATIGDDVSLKEISCPIIFLSPANDFHGRIGDLPRTVKELLTDDWRVTCSPHHNHQDTAPFEVATLLWFDQHLNDAFTFPQTATSTLHLNTTDHVPTLTVKPDSTQQIRSVDVFYTQHGKAGETPSDRENTKHRFWHHAEATEVNGVWTANLPLSTTDKPLWVFANVRYPLDNAVEGAGYYYGTYTADSFNVSSLLQTASADELRSAGVQATRKPSLLIEDFDGEWEKEWFTYKPKEWARSTHKLYDQTWRAPQGAVLLLEVLADKANKLVILLDQHAAEIQLEGGDQWQVIALEPKDFHNFSAESLASWKDIRQPKTQPGGTLATATAQRRRTTCCWRKLARGESQVSQLALAVTPRGRQFQSLTDFGRVSKLGRASAAERNGHNRLFSPIQAERKLMGRTLGRTTSVSTRDSPSTRRRQFVQAPHGQGWADLLIARSIWRKRSSFVASGQRSSFPLE